MELTGPGERLQQVPPLCVSDRREQGADTVVRFGFSSNRREVLLHAALAALVGVVLRFVMLPEALLSHASGQDDFLIYFGVSKALSGLASGMLADRIGRRRTCLIGWTCGVATVIMLAVGVAGGGGSLAALHFANILLGMHQGIAWGVNIICMMDLLGPAGRALASGMSNAIGYLGSAAVAPVAALMLGTDGEGEVRIVAVLALVACGGVYLAYQAKDTCHLIPPVHRSADPVRPSLGLLSGCFGEIQTICALGGLTVNAATGLVWGALVVWCQVEAGLSSFAISWVEVLHTTGKVAAMVAMGHFYDLKGPRSSLIVAFSILLSGLGCLSYQVRSELSWAVLLTAAASIGVGVGAAFPALAAAACLDVPDHMRASAYGAYRMWRDFGYAAGGLSSQWFQAHGGIAATSVAMSVWTAAVLILISSRFPGARGAVRSLDDGALRGEVGLLQTLEPGL